MVDSIEALYRRLTASYFDASPQNRASPTMMAPFPHSIADTLDYVSFFG